MAEEVKKNGGIGSIIENSQGDKVIWMIVIMLILYSLVAVFSSTSLLAIEEHSNRIKIFTEQAVIAAIGMAIILICYNIKSIGFFRFFAQFGYFVSLVLLLMLAGHVRLPFAKAVMINHAWRAIMVFGFQIHVFEVVKILMVLYLAWAVNAYKNDSFWIVNHLSSRHEGLKWLDTDAWKKILYIYLPILITCGLILLGSVSSALFIGFIMVVTILVGGINIKKAILPGIIVVAVCAAGVFGLYKATDGKVFNRIGTAVSRLDKSVDYVAILNSAPKGSPEYVTARDKILQPYSAKLAIKEGGFFGKGPGESTQRYIVPVMFEDYMYSFLIEEYGLLLGGVVVIMLYISLLARGALIANYCENYFAKTAVAGLVILISGQAFMHMAINVGILPQTGQTLPMISHGNSSFLAFSVAFGIILSISRMTHVKMQKKASELAPIVEERPDEVKASLNDLEEMDNID